MTKLEEILRRLYDCMGFRKDLDFCERYDIKPNTLSTWKKRDKIPYELLETISQNENISMDYLLSGKEQCKKTPSRGTLRVLLDDKGTQDSKRAITDEIISNSYVITKLSLEASAGGGIENFQVEEEEDVLLDKTLFRHSVSQDNLRMISVKGDSMEPTILDESHIIIDTSQRESIDGIYAINLGGNIMVKRLQFNLDGTIEIISDNQKYQKKTYNPENNQMHFAILGKKILTIQ